MKFPEHEKLSAVQDKSQAIGEFLEWLTGERGYEIAEYTDSSDWPLPVRYNTQSLLAEFFGIDLVKLDDEKRCMIDAIQST